MSWINGFLPWGPTTSFGLTGQFKPMSSSSAAAGTANEARDTNDALEFAENNTVSTIVLFWQSLLIHNYAQRYSFLPGKNQLLKQDLQTSDLPFKICKLDPINRYSLCIFVLSWEPTEVYRLWVRCWKSKPFKSIVGHHFLTATENWRS